MKRDFLVVGNKDMSSTPAIPVIRLRADRHVGIDHRASIYLSRNVASKDALVNDLQTLLIRSYNHA